jgi:hypothetical protein
MISYIPKAIRPVIDAYVQNLDEIFPDQGYGFYMVGSIALGEFNGYYSDIDFVTTLSRKMGIMEFERLRAVHRSLEKKYPGGRLSGNYFHTCDLGKLDHLAEQHPHYHEGVFHRNGLAEVSSITWWELKNYGIPVVGPDPRSFPFTVDWNLLVERMRENLNSYWAAWTRQPRRILMLYSDWGIQWAVTGILRQFYTFQENTITTKLMAARYGLGCLPPRWHPIIQEAINIRNQEGKSLFPFRTTRLGNAVRFLRFVIDRCNSSYAPV